MQNFSYLAKINLNHINLENHQLKTDFSAEGILIESEGFNTYKPCADSLNILANKLIEQLTKLTKKQFTVAWETHPKDGKSTHITPIDQWEDGHILKFYVIEKTDDPITLENLNPMLSAAIVASKSQRAIYN